MSTDKFYIDDNTVKICIKLIEENLVIEDNDLLIDPCAGNGSFLSGIKSLSNNYRFYDLFPEHSEIIEQDYLELDTSDLKKFNRIHVIGNPPHGKQSSTSIKFIKKSCEFCDTISFILPKSFKKRSMRAKFDKYFELVREFDLPDDVPYVFQIWSKCQVERGHSIKTNPSNFKFVNKSGNPDIAFRRIGVNAGTVSKDIDKNSQSHYFIKFDKGVNIDDMVKKIENSPITHNKAESSRSISKEELTIELNKYIN